MKGLHAERRANEVLTASARFRWVKQKSKKAEKLKKLLNRKSVKLSSRERYARLAAIKGWTRGAARAGRFSSISLNGLTSRRLRRLRRVRS